MSRPLAPKAPQYQTINVKPKRHESELDKDNFKLSLSRLRIDEAQKYIIEQVANNRSKVSYLHLQECLGFLHTLEDRINLAKVLEYALCHNTTLTEVNLSGNGFNDESSTIILQSLNLGHNKNITSLDMSGNEIGDNALLVIGKTLKYNHNLYDLGLRDCNIYYQQASQVKNIFRGNSSITDFDIGNNPFLEFKEGANLLNSIHEIIYYNRNVIFEKGESQLRNSEDNTDSRNSNSTNNSRPAEWQSRRNREERIESRKKQSSPLEDLPETQITSPRGSSLDTSDDKGCCVLQ
jgi:hypothetical protein